MTSKRPPWAGPAAVALIVGTIVAGIAVWAQTPALVGVGYDDAIYALTGRALADGHGFHLGHIPGGVPAIKYPPVYPVSLAPFWLLAGSQETALHAMKLANALYIGAAAGWFVFLLADLAILSLPLAAVVALIGFGSGSMMLVSTTLLAEPLFLALLFPLLWCADRARSEATAGKFLLLGAAAGGVALTRTIGVVVVAVIVIGLWRRCGRRAAALAAAAAATVAAPWFVYAASQAARVPELLVPQYGSYLDLYLANIAGSPGMAVSIVSANLGAIFQTLGGKLVPQAGPNLGSVLGAGLLALALLGARRTFTKAPSSSLFPWLYLVPVSVWSFPPFRFVFILFPLILALAVSSWLSLARRSARTSDGGRRRSRIGWVLLTLGGLALLNLSYREVRALALRVWEPAQMRVTRVGREVIEWVTKGTDSGTVVAFELDPMLALHSGRKTSPNTYTPTHVWYRTGAPAVELTARLLRQMDVEYVAVRRDVPAASAPIDALLGRYPQALHLVHVTPAGAMIFRTDLDRLAGSTEDAARAVAGEPGSSGEPAIEGEGERGAR